MSIKKERIKVYDMTCISCESRVERAIKKLNGVTNAIASYSDQQVIVEYNTELCNTDKIKAAIKQAGYSVESSNEVKIIGIFIIAAAILLLGNSTFGFDMSSKLNGATYFVLFVVGMLTSLHCVGMCGGIMLSQTISKENAARVDSGESLSHSKIQAMKPAILYNAGRVVSYTILGGIVGALGSVLSLSLNVKAGLQIFAGVFMIIMGLNMAGFGLFRKINIKLPWSSCSLKKKPKTPFFVGILNGLMPCGPLQTMQLYALGTGSALKGATSMFLFSLGTVPLMLTFGILSGLLSKGYTKKLLKFSGILVVVLGLIMGNRGLALAGVNLPSLGLASKGLARGLTGSSSSANVGKAVVKDGVQVITMTADGSGYTPNGFYVKKNMPVKWIINGNALNSCNSSIVVPSLNIQKQLKSGENVIEFTPGDKDINFSCWMGMIRGVIKVVDNVDSVDTSKADASIPAPSSGMSCCGGGGSAAPSAPQKPSIYGDNLSKIATDRLVHRAKISGNTQSATIKGIGYELEPLIVVVNNNKSTKLTFDLNEFDSPDGQYTIVNAQTGDTITTFNGKKGVVNVDLNFKQNGGYGIIKDNSAIGVIEVVDNAQTANLDAIRAKYLRQ